MVVGPLDILWFLLGIKVLIEYYCVRQEDERPDDPLESPPAPVRAGHSRKRKSATQYDHGDLKALIKSRVRKLGNPFVRSDIFTIVNF